MTLLNSATWRSSPGVAQAVLASSTQAAPAPLQVRWARHLDEVRAAQRLRFEVFQGEMGAQLRTSVPGHDVDLFDDYCEHLLVSEGASGQVVGTYRVLTPVQAKRVGCFYSDTEFDLVRWRGLRDQVVELGRSCVHPDHRSGGVIMALWGALAQFMQRNELHIMMGCASIPMNAGGLSAGLAAASVWHQLKQSHMACESYRVRPRLPLPLEQYAPEAVQAVCFDSPSLIKGYLRLGAKVTGAPAWDPDFQSADLPMMMRLQDMPARYRQHFLAAY